MEEIFDRINVWWPRRYSKTFISQFIENSSCRVHYSGSGPRLARTYLCLCPSASTKSANIGPSRCWYDLASITPLPKVIATKTFIPDGHHLSSWNLLQYSHDQVVHSAFSKCALEGLKLDRKDVSCEWMIRHRNRNQFYPFFAWVIFSCRAYKFQTFAVIVSCHQTFLSRL